ncbi:unnamed protein product [Durusdinium trenchii]|uniref:Uncharacterized protein n=2 Tax=Durusdinium trenchii TaxID=1381693 RepID=A0ABP0SKR0_9DINO
MAPKAKKGTGAPKVPKARAGGGVAKGKAKAAPVAPAAPTPQDLAAVQIQRFARGFLAKRRLREKKQQQRQLAEALRAAELASLQAERRRSEKERLKAEAKRQKQKERQEDTRALLEAAFEGDEDLVLKFLKKGLPVDAAPASGVTALSEAAAAGKPRVVELLLERKANPNSRGEFKRTPLWRASYSGRETILPLLLEAGADPRLRDEHGHSPSDVCKEELAEVFASWDLERTEELLEDYESWALELRAQELRRQSEEMQDVEKSYEVALQKHQAAQMILAKAKAQMRRREKEWGPKLAAGHKDALDACASADAALQQAEVAAEEAKRLFDQAALARLTAAEQCGATVDLGTGREVPVRELNNVLLRDLGERIALAKRWPLVVDPENIAQKLIQYSGSSLLNFFLPGDMEPERLRMALLTMLRAGGVLALDLLCFGAGVNVELLRAPFEELRPKLFEDLCSRQLLKASKQNRMPDFFDLVTKEERKERFRAQVFDEARTAKFKFMVLTTTELPHPELKEYFDLIRVIPNL